MIFLFFTSPLAPLEAEICPIEVWHGIFLQKYRLPISEILEEMMMMTTMKMMMMVGMRVRMIPAGGVAPHHMLRSD